VGTRYSDMTDGVAQRATDELTGYRSGANVRFPATCLVARAHNSTGGYTFANSTTTVINWNTVDYDPLSTITTGAAWHFTVPATGYFNFVLVDVLISPEGAAYTAAKGVDIETWVNGSYINEIGYVESDGTAATNHWLFLAGSGALSLTAGDSVSMKLGNFSGATRRLATASYLEIYRVA
jgi:hypothetical protein